MIVMGLMRIAFTIAGMGIAAQAFADANPVNNPRCDRQIVMQIDSAQITAGPDGFTIDAFGVSESAGWKTPTLVLAGAPSGGVATVDFVACRPEVSAQVLTPIQTRVTLDLDLSTRQIIIRAKTNSMTVDITKQP
jgi:hypothetical protein